MVRAGIPLDRPGDVVRRSRAFGWRTASRRIPRRPGVQRRRDARLRLPALRRHALSGAVVQLIETPQLVVRALTASAKATAVRRSFTRRRKRALYITQVGYPRTPACAPLGHSI